MCLKYTMDHTNSIFTILQWLQITFSRKSTVTWNARPFMVGPLPASSVSPPRMSPISLHTRHTTLSISLKAPTHLCSLVLLFRTPFSSISAQQTPFQPPKLSSGIFSSGKLPQDDCVYPLCTADDSCSIPGGHHSGLWQYGWQDVLVLHWT